MCPFERCLQVIYFGLCLPYEAVLCDSIGQQRAALEPGISAYGLNNFP